MALIDKESLAALHAEIVATPIKRLGGIPKLCGEVLGLVVLHSARNPSRDALVSAVGSLHENFVEHTVGQVILAVREENAPHTRLCILEKGQRSAIPPVKVAENVDALGGRQPFAEPPTSIALIPLEAEIAVAICKVDNRPTRGLDVGKFVGEQLVTIVELAFHRLEPTIFFYD